MAHNLITTYDMLDKMQVLVRSALINAVANPLLTHRSSHSAREEQALFNWPPFTRMNTSIFLQRSRPRLQMSSRVAVNAVSFIACCVRVYS